ncbi:MAG: hypothetical protein QOH25_1800 [Acidobacteriota bacterium]|nr:hypothetical protein [Acidobacteriota bacterium]
MAQGASNETDRSPDSKRKYYAGLLNISTKRFRYADYVLRHGNDEEKRELDTGPRSLTTIYEAVHARVNNLAESSALAPGEICSLTRNAARSAVRVIAESGIQPHTNEASVEEELDALTKQARQESAGVLPRGTTLENALELLVQIFTRRTSRTSDKDGRINEQKPNQFIADNEAAHALPQTSDSANAA